MNTATVSLAVTPTVLSTFVSHYVNRKPRRQKPTAHISYDEGLHLIRSFLAHASQHTVEDLQAFTSQWVPHPQWVKVDEVKIHDTELARAASLLSKQLGPEGIRRVGGKEWWQWRKPGSPLKAEWIEMKSDYYERKKNIDPGNRVILYIHGGAYYFGSVDEHRYQIQRHARKLKARVIAPRYRLAPQFPFPCGLQDCLATYLYLLTQHEPSAIVLAGDSAGGSMILSLLVILRDRGIPLPAGAVLISPWVDLTHSFPSVSEECPLDYIPASGFHHKPSMAWPPPNEGELGELKRKVLQQKKQIQADKDLASSSECSPTLENIRDTTTRLSLLIDGQNIEITEQIQIYTTNELLTHPLVSPVLQPTLGGLPPLLIMVGGGEMLRDEQIYIAHKCANPEKYLPPAALMDEYAEEQVEKYPPTDVQLQVWEELCHVAPTLSFTSPAKYMYRSIAQFSAWCLARAQRTQIDILDDDQISVISAASSAARDENQRQDRKDKGHLEKEKEEEIAKIGRSLIGKAGDPLPPFTDHMIRQRVNFHGTILPLPPAEELPACTIPREQVGALKAGPVRKWLDHKKRWDTRFRQSQARVHKQRMHDMSIGYEVFGDGEVPPPTALAGRRTLGGEEFMIKKKAKSLGLALWSLWGSRHDQMTVRREREADGDPRVKNATSVEGEGARTYSDIQGQERVSPSGKFAKLVKLRPSRRRLVRDEKQVAEEREEPVVQDANLLSPGHAPEEKGVTGKRVFIEGLATPFSLRKEAETASMITLQPSRPTTPGMNSIPFLEKETGEKDDQILLEGDDDVLSGSTVLTTFANHLHTPVSLTADERPGLERFVTAQEVPQVK